MAKLIYGMITSLDGYTEDEHGRFGWGAPEDEGVHSYINELASSVGTYQPTALHSRLGAAVAGGREDSLLQDPRRAAECADADRAGVRSRRGPAPQSRHPAGHHR